MPSRSLGTSTLAVLAAVAQGVRYGFDVMDRTGLQSGTVYRALGRLEELGLLASDWEDAAVALAEKRPRRRYYVIRPDGSAELVRAEASLRALARWVSLEPVGEGGP